MALCAARGCALPRTPRLARGGRMRLAVDVDEVLFPFYEHLSAYRASLGRGGGCLSAARPTRYVFTEAFGMKDRECKELVRDFYSSPLHAGAPPIAGSRHGLNDISTSFDVYAVTGRQVYAIDRTEEWLERHFQGLIKDVVFTNSYSLVGQSMCKARACALLGAHVFLDDLPENCREVERDAGIPSVLFGNYPWNAHANDLDRIESW